MKKSRARKSTRVAALAAPRFAVFSTTHRIRRTAPAAAAFRAARRASLPGHARALRKPDAAARAASRFAARIDARKKA